MNLIDLAVILLDGDDLVAVHRDGIAVLTARHGDDDIAAHLIGLLGHHRTDHVRALRRGGRFGRNFRRFRRLRLGRDFRGFCRLRLSRRFRRGRFVEVFHSVRREGHIGSLGGKVGFGHHL